MGWKNQIMALLEVFLIKLFVNCEKLLYFCSPKLVYSLILEKGKERYNSIIILN